MALRTIVQDGDPILKKVCKPVVKFDDRLAQLLDDMAETLLDANGLGLAAPQVGVMRRVFIALDEGEDEEEAPEDEEAQQGEEVPEGEEEPEAVAEPKILEFINPEILSQEGERKIYEGCLSFPGKYGAIVRPAKVTVKAFDRNGNPFTMEAKEMLARCICHETNHLDGITIDDLAEYFYDPETPHELDGNFEEDQEETGDEN
ncbi:MAG: peptide deformylase [Oscillospiraceae bacterium]